MGLLVYLCAMEKQKGGSLDEVKTFAEQTRLHVCHWFTVDDLNHLKRGGRISAATALFGTMLSIKPVMHVDDEGRLIPVSKARGRRASLLALVDRMAQTAIDPANQTVFISHGDCLEDAEFVASELRPPAERPDNSHQLRGTGHRQPFRPRHHGAVLPRHPTLRGAHKNQR